MVWQAEPRSFAGRGFFILACAAFGIYDVRGWQPASALSVLKASERTSPPGASSSVGLLLAIDRVTTPMWQLFARQIVFCL
jgi:hypothetical protein